MVRFVEDAILRTGGGLTVWSPEAAAFDPATFVSASTAAAGAATVAPSTPASIQVGDTMVGAVAANSSLAELVPSGVDVWTGPVAQASQAGASLAVYTRIVDGTEDATQAFADDNAGATHIRATIVAYRPAAGTGLLVAGDAQANGSGTAQATPSVTPSGGNATLVVAGACTSGHSWTAPTGMTERADAGTHMTVGVFDLVPVGSSPVSKTATLDTAAVADTAIVALVPGTPPATFVAASTDAAAGTSCGPAPPSGIQAGDVMVAAVATDDGTPFIGGGAGNWTAVPGFAGTVSVAGVLARAFYRVADGGEPAAYTALDFDDVATKIRATIVAYRPAAGTTLAAAGSAQGNASGTAQATPTITPAGDGATLVVFGAAAAGHSWTAPGGMTERADDGATMTIGAFDAVQNATAAAVSETATLDLAAVAVMAIVALVPG